MNTIALLPAHPAQVWILNQVASELESQAEIRWYLRDKDRSAEIAKALGIDFKLLSRARRGLIGNGFEMLLDTFRAIGETRKRKIDLWVTKFGSGNIAAKLLQRKSLSFNDDDADLVPLIAKTSYNFADAVLVTDVTRMHGYEHKAIRYPSFHELFYLHPNRFKPDPNIRAELGLSDRQRYGIIRLSALTAHHDRDIRGMKADILAAVLRKCDGKVKIFISSEKPLCSTFARHEFRLNPIRMHHALANAEFFLGDSQTMTAEAAVLGTPALRLSDFVGRISYISELERYGLAVGHRPGDERALLEKLDYVLHNANVKTEFAAKRNKMLLDKIDPAPWFARQVLAVCASRPARLAL